MLVLSPSLPSPLASSHQDEAVLCPGSSPSPLSPPDLSGTLSCSPVSSPQGIRNRDPGIWQGPEARLPGCRKEAPHGPAPLITIVPSRNKNGAAWLQRTALQTCKPPDGPCPTFTETQRQERLWPGLGDGQMLEPCRAEERKVEKSKVEGKERGQALETGELVPHPGAVCSSAEWVTTSKGLVQTRPGSSSVSAPHLLNDLG